MLSPSWLLVLGAPWLDLPWRARRRLPSGRGRLAAAVVASGLVLMLLRLPALPGAGRVCDVAGRWEETRARRGRAFTGGLAGRPRLRLRGLGDASPAPGSAFYGRALVLPGRGRNEREARLLEWCADAVESPARRAGRLGRPAWRHRLALRLTRPWPASLQPLARALLLGVRRGLPADTRRRFRDAGLAHLLALSGLHVGLFLLLWHRLLAASRLGAAGAERLLLALLPALPLLLGDGPSILRAVSMAAYVLGLRLLGGRPLPFEALSAAACLELLARPGSLLHPAFALSYLATFVLVARFSAGTARRAGVWWNFWRGVDVSFHCSLATLPVALAVFGRLPLLGPLWNLAAGPLCALALMLGWLSLPLALLPGATLWTAPAALALRLLAGLADLAGGPLALTAAGLAVPVAGWLPWSLGLRFLVLGRPRAARLAPLLMVSPLLVALARAGLDSVMGGT
ncbi:MAG: ComEC/Rec2 family competence protein [Candidatus Krumholzibacteriota bacterium]|nr:ComEC/Rec2 family competence protein [Candidatus Krumholzibacteriota bacterium]